MIESWSLKRVLKSRKLGATRQISFNYRRQNKLVKVTNNGNISPKSIRSFFFCFHFLVFTVRQSSFDFLHWSWFKCTALVLARSPPGNPQCSSRVCRVYPLIPRVNIKLVATSVFTLEVIFMFPDHNPVCARFTQLSLSLSLSLSRVRAIILSPVPTFSSWSDFNKLVTGATRRDFASSESLGSLVSFNWTSSPFNQVLIKRILDLVSLAISSS